MESIKPRISETGQERLILELARQYSHPLKALKEPITNGVDAASLVKDGLVNILLSPMDTSVVIADTGIGMDEGRMRELPVNIGESVKAGKTDQRGEKGVGLLSFGSIGSHLHLISRTSEDSGYNYLHYEVSGDKLNTEFGRLNETDMDRDFHGGFEHGTKAIVNVNPAIFKKRLAVSDIKRFVQEQYTPLLVSGDVPFWLGTDGKQDQKIIGAPVFQGERFLKRNLPFEVKRSGKAPELMHLGMLLYVDINSDKGKVSVHSKDVRVYDSVTQLDESIAELDLWKCRQVHGYINEPNLSLTLGRDGINRNSNAYKALIELLERIHENEWPDLEQKLKKRKVERSDRILGDAMKEIEKAYKGTKPLNVRVRGPTGKRGPRNPPSDDPPPPKERRFPFGTPRRYEFDIQDNHLRTKLEEDAGVPIVALNSGHGHYQGDVRDGTEQTARSYYLEVIPPAMAIWEIKKAISTKDFVGDEYDVAAEVVRRSQDLRQKIKK